MIASKFGDIHELRDNYEEINRLNPFLKRVTRLKIVRKLDDNLNNNINNNINENINSINNNCINNNNNICEKNSMKGNNDKKMRTIL